MDSMAEGTFEHAKARFACEHCRRKKLRCSKDLPKCTACRPWPSACEYSRDKSGIVQRPQKRAKAANEGPHRSSQEVAAASSTVGIQTYTQYEVGIGLLPAGQVDGNLAAFEGEPQTIVAGSGLRPKTRSSEQKTAAGLVPAIISSFSFLEDASNHLDTAVEEDLSDSMARRNARAQIHQLSTTVSLAPVDSVTRPEAEKEFFVPTRQAGYALISHYLTFSSLGRLFFQDPADDCLRQVIFEPDKVKQRAWVVFVNYMLLSTVSTNPARSEEAQRFRLNVHLALDNAEIFLNPSIINVQTLVLLAIHGEDFATPKQSWMLVGHACRQAEALGLQAPAQAGSAQEQQRLCLFWLLFLTDKCSALAFGRHPSLPTSKYADVPLPDPEYLAQNCAHVSEVLNGESSPRTSAYGAKFYNKGFELAKLVGKLLDAPSESRLNDDGDQFERQLDQWQVSTSRDLYAAMETEKSCTSAVQQREMLLGLRCFKFQYLHIRILLLRDDTSRSSVRLDSAREALSILPEIVSNWGSVYNGIVWQLLYYPFVPFFVVFGHLMQEPAAWTVKDDLSLLSATVIYFESMRAQLSLLSNLSGRLAHTADVFLALARHRVSAAASKAPRSQQEQQWDIADLDLAAIENYLRCLPADMTNIMPAVSDSSLPGVVAEEQVAGPAQGKPFIDTFDWFSWDAYYADGLP